MIIKVRNIFKEVFESGFNLPIWSSSLIAILVGLMSFVAIKFDIGLYLLGSIFSLILLFFVFSNPKTWLYSIVLSGVVFYTTSDKGVSVLDSIVAAYLLGSLFVWFVNAVVIQKIKITRNYADWIFLLFYFGAALNGIIAVLNGAEFLNWFREFLLLCLTLFYFPIRHYFDDKDDLVKLLIVVATVYFFVDLFQFYSYYNLASKKLMYAYELARTSRVNQSLMTAASIGGIVFFFYCKQKKHRLLILIYTATSIAALITTFSRTFWVILIIQSVIVFLIISNKKKIEFFLLMLFVVGAAIGLGFLFMRDNTKLLFGVIESRFVSTSDGKKDVSVQARLSEYKAAWTHIKASPLGGNGLAKYDRYYDPIEKIMTEFHINHNVYIHFTYRLGFPLAFCFFFFFFYQFVLGSYLTLKIKNLFYKSLSLASTLSLFLMLVGGFTTPIMAYRDGIFVDAFAASFIGLAYAYYKKERAAEIEKVQIETSK